MSGLNYLVRDPILSAGFPWRTAVDIVRGRVFTMLYCSLCSRIFLTDANVEQAPHGELNTYLYHQTRVNS